MSTHVFPFPLGVFDDSQRSRPLSVLEQSRKRNKKSIAAARARRGGKDVPDNCEAIKKLAEATKESRKQYVLDDFVYDLSTEIFWNLVTMTQHKAESVNASVPRSEWSTKDVPRANGNGFKVVPEKPSDAIARVDSGNVVESAAWWPGMPRIIKDVVVTTDGEKHVRGSRCLNTYQAPKHHAQGDPAMAALWVEHIHKLWPDDHELLLDYFAHTVQHPEEKINFGIVLIGAQGIGKDMALTPVRAAVGNSNCSDVSPDDITSTFNGWVKSLLIIINEARPSDSDFKATDFYERLKPYFAAPPDWLLRNGKYQKTEHVRNLARVVITTNDPLALFVPEDDRRLYFAQSRLESGWADSEYFYQLAAYYTAGGLAHVYAYLRQRDVSKFDPKRQPAPNAAHIAATASWNSPVHDPISDVLDKLCWPDLFFGRELLDSEIASFDNREEVVNLLKSSRKLARRMNELGYQIYHHPEKNGEWKWVNGEERYRARMAFVKKGFCGNLSREIETRGLKNAKAKPKAKLEVVK